MTRILVTAAIFGVVFATYYALEDRIKPKLRGRPVLAVVSFVLFFAAVGAVFALLGLY
jgi:MFS-type transporter involved in bile tolerance (Atg22 family)